MRRLLCGVLMIAGLLMVTPERVLAQDEFSIDLLDVKKGLLSNFVTKTISDDKQFKYFATEGGISRYDGYAFKHYRPSVGSNGLTNENIETLFSSKAGFIWIGTKTGGLSRLNVKTQVLENWNDVFSTFTNKPLRIVSLTEDTKGNIWVGTWNIGCFKVDPIARKVVEHFPSGSTIFNIICDSKGTIWYTDGRDLCAYKNESGALQRYVQPFNIFNICEDTARNRVWFTGNLEPNAGLAYFDQMQGLTTQVPINFKARFVSSLAIDQKMRIWLGSWGDGLFVSDPAVKNFQKINTSGFAGTIRNTNHNAITNIYIDKTGIAWLSTSYGGVLVLYPNKGFLNLANNQDSELKDYNVLAFGTDQQNRLLIGSISSGLYEVGNPLQPDFNRNSLLPNARINQIYQKNGRYFVGTNEGLFIFQQGLNSQPKRYFPAEKITSVLLSENELWVGTQQYGLHKMKFDQVPDTANSTFFTEFAPPPLQIDNDRINKIFEDSRGNLWVATHSGLNLWDAKARKFLSHKELFANKLPGIIVHDLLVTGEKMYLATPNGLFKISINLRANAQPMLTVEEHFNENNSLVNQFICALQEDRNGNIWFSSTTGITKLNTLTGVLHHFGKQDGVQVNAFHITSSYHDSDGALYFGGDNGLVYFNPEAVIANYQKPTLVITGLNINNQPVEIDMQGKGKGKPILSEAIQYTSSLSLNYHSNDIALQFAANDFLGTENISYAYKLEPDDKDWVLLREKNEVTFTGLRPGKHRLLLRANRNNQGWGNPTEISLQIAYPPWLAWYAWVFYVLLITGIVVAIRKFRLRQEKLKMELQRVQFEKEKEHEINEAKINFFTNISHEFRTPLTLILSPCTELLATADSTSPEYQKISLVKSNAQKLLRLINQLLDFRKSEHGLLSLRTQEEDIKKLIMGLLNDFTPAAKAKNIALSLEAEAAEMPVDIDKGQMEIAINNLLSNAIKFTPANGTVTVKLDADSKFFSIRVRDNGIGIDAQHIDKVFNRFYQVPESGAQLGGSGIGLAFTKNIVELHKGTISVDSSPGKGAEFAIKMPIRQSGVKAFDTTDDHLENEDDAIATIHHSRAANASSNKQSILVVDDNDDIRLYLAGLLKEEFEVLEAEDGSVGYKIALEAMPDLIISDVMMPQMNGIDMCRELKNNMATSHIPIMLLTARASEAFELNGLQTGADDYITKPFNPLIVQTRVRNMLENRKKLKAFYLKKVRFEPETEGKPADNLDEIFLNKAIDLVNTNLQHENLGIEMMVDHLFMSQSTLFRKIKSLTGLSITGFIRALRIKKAAQLILQSNMKMSDVAFEVGFNDYKYFKKSFQQQFGCLPSEYREKHTENYAG